MSTLFGFSTYSFEQFVQTVAIHVMGPGVVVFGAGPDGGREATFKGQVPYPFESDQWNGYGVVQAKYKSKTEGTAIDQAWALKQLANELELFVESAKRNPKPEYFIFATNVVLTPVAESGGKDEVDKLIRSYYGKLPLKGHSIWDHDQLQLYIAAHEQIRIRFKAHLTSGDVLDKLSKAVEGLTPDFVGIATSFLDRELRAEQDAKLDQAGKRTDERIALASVFYDLPVTRNPTQEPPLDRLANGRLPIGFVSNMLNLGSFALDPKSIFESRAGTGGRKLLNRLVLIGGPGSGKSTVSQFLAQIHRAAYLARREQHTLILESTQIINAIKLTCAAEGIDWPATPRFVFRIDLSAFARELAGNKSLSLATYLTNRLTGDRNLSVEDLFRWLPETATLLILDGLDEVPPSSNRESVCTRIQDFLSEAARMNLDIFVIATTRNEGYNGEFGNADFEYRYLPPLSKARALSYVEKFAKAKYGVASPRVAELVLTISEAATNDLTAKLMRTPLQVAFLATLASAGGKPPRERWKLFHDYYETIYKREQQKADFGSVLHKHSTLIQRLHHDVGFLLQVRSELPGKTDAMMSLDEFKIITKNYLTEEEWDLAESDNINGQITDAATLRLVFLTGKVAGKVGFDIRSLQEFMAAERLMSGPQDFVHKRLRAIAALPYWRNVVLFCAAQCFAQPQLEYLRPTILEICEELNDPNEDAAAGNIYSGSRLALDLLEDGTIAQVPRHARRFTQIALKALEIPFPHSPSGAQETLSLRLARLCNPVTETLFQQHVNEQLTLNQLPHSLPAWNLLLHLADKHTWAVEKIRASYPQTQKELALLARAALSTERLSPIVLEVLTKTIPNIVPTDFILAGDTYDILEALTDVDGVPDWLRAAASILHSGWTSPNCVMNISQKDNDGEEHYPISFDIEFVDSVDGVVRTALRDMPEPSAGWKPYLASARLLPLKFSVDAMARELTALSIDEEFDLLWKQWRMVPWPFGFSLQRLKPGATDIVEKLRAGNLANYDAWLAAENRWKTKGVDADEIGLSDVLPFDHQIAMKGFPSPCSWHVSSSACSDKVLSYLFDSLGNAKAHGQCEALSEMIAVAISFGRKVKIKSPDPAIFEKFISSIPAGRFDPVCLEAFGWDTIDLKQYVEALAKIEASQIGWSRLGKTSFSKAFWVRLEANFIADPTLSGLLHLIAYLVSNGYRSAITPDLLPSTLLPSPQLQRSALILRLSQAKWQKEEEQELASHILEMSGGDITLFDAFIRTLLFRDNPAEALSLLSALKKVAGKGQWPIQREIFSNFSRIIQIRKSGLVDIDSAKDLDLPTGASTKATVASDVESQLESDFFFDEEL